MILSLFLVLGSLLINSLTSYPFPVCTDNPNSFLHSTNAPDADHFAGLDFTHFPPHPIHESATPERLRQYYSQQLSHPGYKRLLDTNITVFGTMDDHDYGANNGDRTYRYRRESGMAYVDFVGEPDDSPIRKRAVAGKGVYGVKVFDFAKGNGDELVSDADAGIDPDVVDDTDADVTYDYSNRSVAVFVLDVRSNRTPWRKGLGAWMQSDTGDMLGDAQWQWFEAAIRRSRASVNIIVSGLQVHANRFPNANIAEEWVKFPRSRQRLYETILQEGVKAPFIVSGDVHMAQLLRKDCFKRTGDGAVVAQHRARPLVELTTSGLTHSWGTCFASSKKYHSSWYSPYFHFLSRTSMSYGHMDWVCPWTELVRTTTSSSISEGSSSKDTVTVMEDYGLHENGGAEGAKVGKQFYLELNFGELEFDWDQRTVSMRIVGIEGPDMPMLGAKWSFDQLSGDVTMPGSIIDSHDISSVASKLSSNDQWVCVNYQGVAHPVHYFLGTFSGAVLLFSLILLPNILSVLAVLVAVRFVLRRMRPLLWK